jgi:hypothetical protein
MALSWNEGIVIKIVEMRLMKKVFFIFFMVIASSYVNAQDYLEWDDQDVQEFYEKLEVEDGTLDEDGEEISFVLVPKQIKQGVYKVTISDFTNDVYEIKGTTYYVKFRGYYGYAGYGDEGVLVVGRSAYASTFYKKP